MQTSKRQVNTDYQNEMQREVEKKNNKKKKNREANSRGTLWKGVLYTKLES